MLAYNNHTHVYREHHGVHHYDLVQNTLEAEQLLSLCCDNTCEAL